MKKLGFGTQCLLALLLGAIFGMTVPAQIVSWVAPLGAAFIQLLKMKNLKAVQAFQVLFCVLFFIF